MNHTYSNVNKYYNWFSIFFDYLNITIFMGCSLSKVILNNFSSGFSLRQNHFEHCAVSVVGFHIAAV